ncbi:MAG: hypothetical protein ACE37H_12220 [Phycisphaeraceae bacterium]
MTRWTNTLGCLTLAACFLLLPGCIKFKQVVTVMPDGAGKIEMQVGLSDQLVAMAKQEGQDPFKEMVPSNMEGKAKGIVAYTKPKREKVAGYTYLTFSMYFRDINEVEMDAFGEGEAPEFEYSRKDDTATLTITNGTVLSMLKDYEPTEEAEKAQIKQMMAGLEFKEHYVLPGLFKDIEGVAGVDNTAKLDISLDDLIDDAGPVKALKGKDKLTFEVTDITLDDAQVNAFNKELQEAIEAWEKMKAEEAAAE